MSTLVYNEDMNNNEYEIEIYSTEDGKAPFTVWFNSFKDTRVKDSLLRRIRRLQEGNFGDFKFFDGIYELRIDNGSGYRIYCTKQGKKLILLLGGGDKKTQTKDIKRCLSYLEDHKSRGKL